MSTYMISTYEQWLNEKMVIPSLEEYPPAPMEPIAVKKQDTQELLQEFESVYDAVELTHLTPPQTPPQTSPQRLAIGDAGQCIDQTFIYQEPILYGTVSAPASFYALAQDQQHGEKCVNNLEFSLASFPGVEEAVAAAGANMIEIAVQSPMPADIDHEMELVDELVRSRAKDLPDWTDDDNSSEFMSSPASLSPRSEASYSGSSFSHDDEWLPESRAKATTSKAAGVSGVTAGGVRKRSRPYARGTEDKKSRKKEQNKNAATRYRKKKKMEIEEVLEIERALQRDHEKLRAEATDLKREIKYLKGLMREVYKAKGLLD
ncbi:activating transcription factor of chaperone isoform X2 [Lutzomyia longipalpis]|uniref:BZIP domain-containing protein n=2 Tax=Lutzomyia longipalpis TaxID=7200 RepID=A0A1B0ET40_LUTLO|nr:activating transcription factor of chaperone isoform X2 [Lutzomyia longipalpis]